MFVFIMSSLSATSANYVGFEQDFYTQNSGQVSIDLVYDFSDFPVVGGGVDIIYDYGFIEFVSYTQAPLASDVHPSQSPVGALSQPGLYTGPGIGYLGPFGGITSAGTIGTFVFSVIGTPTNSTPCGATLCITGNAVNPFISLMGIDVTAELLDNGFNSAEVVVVPLPATLWLLLSGVVFIAGSGRK